MAVPLMRIGGVDTIEADELFRMAFDNAPIGMALVSPDGRFLLVNRALVRLTGYTEEQLVAGRFQDITHPDDLDADLDYVQQMLKGQIRTYSMEKRYIRADGSQVWVQLSVSLVREPDGRPRYFISQIQDIDERKHADAKFRGLLDAAPDAMVIVDDTGQITLVNARAEQLFGYDRDELVGATVEVLVPAYAQEIHRQHRAQFATAPHPRMMGAGLDLHAVTKHGAEIPVEVSLSLLDAPGGNLTIAAIRDVSERLRLEHGLRKANEELQAANASKDRFLATVGHELRTPMNAILGFAASLLRGFPGPLNTEQTTQVRFIESSGQHLLALISGLLDAATIEAGKRELHPELVNCQAVLTDIAAQLAPLVEQKDLTLNVTPGPPRPIHADERALRQILINLTANAIKFTDYGEIHLTIAPELSQPGRVSIQVSDTGRGIAQRDQERLFAAFEQITHAHTRPDEGTGLGLYISQSLATLMGGTITFDSTPGTGSTFTLHLPNA